MIRSVILRIWLGGLVFCAGVVSAAIVCIIIGGNYHLGGFRLVSLTSDQTATVTNCGMMTKVYPGVTILDTKCKVTIE